MQASSPACTELETIVMDWLAKAIGVPSVFYHSNKETLGGGVIQVNRSDIITLSYRVSATVMFSPTFVCLSVCLYVHVLIFTRTTLR